MLSERKPVGVWRDYSSRSPPIQWRRSGRIIGSNSSPSNSAGRGSCSNRKAPEIPSWSEVPSQSRVKGRWEIDRWRRSVSWVENAARHVVQTVCSYSSMVTAVPELPRPQQRGRSPRPASPYLSSSPTSGPEGSSLGRLRWSEEQVRCGSAASRWGRPVRVGSPKGRTSAIRRRPAVSHASPSVPARGNGVRDCGGSFRR